MVKLGFRVRAAEKPVKRRRRCHISFFGKGDPLLFVDRVENETFRVQPSQRLAIQLSPSPDAWKRRMLNLVNPPFNAKRKQPKGPFAAPPNLQSWMMDG